MADTLALLVVSALVWGVCALWPAHVPFLGPYVFDPLLFCPLWAGLVWYGRGLARLAERPHWARVTSALLGWAAIYFVLQTHFEYWAEHLFALDRTQALVSGMAGPFLLSFGRLGPVLEAGAPDWARHVARAVAPVVAGLARPVPAALLMLGATDVWLIPTVQFDAMLNPWLYDLMLVSCFYAGLLFWLMVLDDRPNPPCRFSFIVRGATGFLVMFPQMPVSAYIALTSRDLYTVYAVCGRLFPLMSAQYDQLLGGIIQWIPAGALNTAALLVSLNALRHAEEKADRAFVPPPGAKVYEAKWTGR
jgi:putative membrane protein